MNPFSIYPGTGNPVVAPAPAPTPPASRETIIDAALADAFADLRARGDKPTFQEVWERANQRQPSAFT